MPRKNPANIRVEHRNVALEGERQNCPRCVWTDSW
jgi:hypothetical protein